jgi:hypothetical protein
MLSSKTVEILVRCIAVYAVVPFVNSLADWLTIALSGGTQGPLLVATVLRLLLVLLLWLLAPVLGRRLAVTAEAPRSFLGLDEIAPLAFGLVGITLAVLGLAALAVGAADMVTTPHLMGAPELGAAPLWGGTAQLLAGLGVFAGSRALGRAFVAIRRA